VLLIWISMDFSVHDFFGKSYRVPIKSQNIFYVGAAASLFLTIRASWRSSIRRSIGSNIDHRHRYYFAGSVRTFASRITLHSSTSTFRLNRTFIHQICIQRHAQTQLYSSPAIFVTHLLFSHSTFHHSLLSLSLFLSVSFIFNNLTIILNYTVQTSNYILNIQVILQFLIASFFHEIWNFLMKKGFI